MVKRRQVSVKRVSVKLAKLRVPGFRDSSSDSSSSLVSINVSTIKRNNKLLARALNESREKIRDLETSIMTLRTENVELRVQMADLKAQLVQQSPVRGRGYSEADLSAFLEPLKGICHEALNHTVSLTGEITRALTYINAAPQVTPSLLNGLPPRRSIAPRHPRNKVKKVSPMVSGHIVHKPEIKIKKLDMRLLLGEAAREGIRIHSQDSTNGYLFEDSPNTREEEEEEATPNGNREEEVLSEAPEEEEAPEDEEEEGEITPRRRQVQKFLSRSCQPQVSLRPFDMSLIEEDLDEEEEEIPRRRRVTKSRLTEKLRSSEVAVRTAVVDTILSSEEPEEVNDSLLGGDNSSLNSDFVPKEVTDVIVNSSDAAAGEGSSSSSSMDPPRDPPPKEKPLVAAEEEETPRSKMDASDKLFMEMVEHDPQEGPSWLFEDLFEKNKRKSHTRHSLRRKTSSNACSKKLSFVNYCPDPRELRPYDDGSSSDDLSFDEDDEAFKKPPPAPPKAKGKRSRASSVKKGGSKKSSASKRAKIDKEEPSLPPVLAPCVEVVNVEQEEQPSTSSSERPRRAAAASSLKEPSLNSKMRNPNATAKGKKSQGSKSKKKSG